VGWTTAQLIKKNMNMQNVLAMEKIQKKGKENKNENVKNEGRYKENGKKVKLKEKGVGKRENRREKIICII
jgi:hypothetical protein